MNGLPVYPFWHVHTGLWFTVWHTEFVPHAPGQGSTHLWFLQALLNKHSELTTHSGRQPGGLPTYSRKHEQTAWPWFSLHSLFGPHGEGWHGFIFGGIAINEYK